MLGIGLWLRIGILVAFIGAALLAWHQVAIHYRAQGALERQPEVDALKSSIEQTRARASALALLWSDSVTKTEAQAAQTETSHAQTFAILANDARRVAADSPARFGSAANVVFDRARSAAGGETAGPAAKPDATAAANSESAEEFIVSLYDWIGVCKSRVDEWASFYAGLQQSTVKEQ